MNECQRKMWYRLENGESVRGGWAGVNPLVDQNVGRENRSGAAAAYIS